jgi:SAM-dependent methyltransferase
MKDVMSSSLERKRPREHDNNCRDDVDRTLMTTTPATTALNTHSNVVAAATTPTPKSLPPYGSQDYWEQRYAKLVADCSRNDEIDGAVNKDKDDRNDTPDPFHAWYFNFDELAPLILPLILGDGGNNNNAEEEEEEQKLPSSSSLDDDHDIHEERSNDNEVGVTQRCHQDNSNTGENFCISDDTNVEINHYDQVDSHEDDDQYDEEEVDDDNDEMDAVPPCQPGLAHKGPISVMEVGCGDMPLGRDLLSAVLELEAEASVDASNILQNVVCLDYSKNVIEAMKSNQYRRDKSTNIKEKKKSTIPLTYQVADARNLPYQDATFDLILEKGTLDAMLSDRDGDGPENCRKIVAECARVATAGGCIVVISHLNAHCQTGLQWLHDIVMPGLRCGAPNYQWSLEVHGNEADIPSEDDEDGNVDNSHQEHPASPGPAVYIIRKGIPNEQQQQVQTTIPLRFFSY